MNSYAILATAQWTPPQYWKLIDDACSNVETSWECTGSSTKRMGKLSSAFEKPTNKSAAYPYWLCQYRKKSVRKECRDTVNEGFFLASKRKNILKNFLYINCRKVARISIRSNPFWPRCTNVLYSVYTYSWNLAPPKGWLVSQLIFCSYILLLFRLILVHFRL